MKPLKEKVSITLDTDLLEKIRYLAEYDDRSLSQNLRCRYKNAAGVIPAAFLYLHLKFSFIAPFEMVTHPVILSERSESKFCVDERSEWSKTKGCFASRRDLIGV